MFITRSSEPGKQLALNHGLVGEGRNKSSGSVGLPLGGRAGTPSWNPAAPRAGPVVSPWQPTDLRYLLERPQLPASWAHFPQHPVCHHHGESRGERRSSILVHGGTGAGPSGVVLLIMTRAWGRGHWGVLRHLRRDLGPRPPLVAASVACQLFHVAFLKLQVPKIGLSTAPQKTVDVKRMNSAFY